MFLHVSLNKPSSGSSLLCFAKVMIVKVVSEKYVVMIGRVAAHYLVLIGVHAVHCALHTHQSGLNNVQPHDRYKFITKYF